MVLVAAAGVASALILVGVVALRLRVDGGSLRIRRTP